ncbi:MAG: glutathione S-transferase [Deltaproteobacteria bacterium]|nr:MAG: glutathione S-transferase [Deltaproteobacteria bacterium]
MATPLLWHFPISHFNEKVRWALDWKRIPHVRRTLGPDYLPRVWWATGRGTLPVLWLDAKAIGDSTRIIEALERRWPEPPLYPRDESVRRRALAPEDFFDEELGHPLRAAIIGPLLAQDPDGVVAVLTLGMPARARRTARAIFPVFRAFYRWRHAINAATIQAGREKMAAALDRIAAELQPSGYLAGDTFSVADLTAAALFAPLVIPPELQYRVPEPLPSVLVGYRSALGGHPAYRWVRDMYRRHRGTSAEVAA